MISRKRITPIRFLAFGLAVLLTAVADAVWRHFRGGYAV